MKVRMKVAVSGGRNGRRWPPIGGVTDLPDSEGADLCAAGLAVPVATDEVERAVAPEPEERDTESPTTTRTAESTTRRGPGRPRKSA